MEEKNNKIRIDFSEVAKKIWGRKRLLIKVWIITFILSCVWIFPQPRYYKCEISIAPETSNVSGALGNLSSIASNFGFNIGDMKSSDAIYPQLYPELLKSTKFLVELFDIQIQTADGKIKTDYYTYLVKHQKECIWDFPKNLLGSLIEMLTDKDEKPVISKDGKRFDPFKLSKKDSRILEGLTGKISTSYSKKTDVVSLTVEDQDPLVCALMADSIMKRLQDYITAYRTKKARIDYEYYKNLNNQAKQSYEQARRKYASFADANQDILLKSVKAKEEDLENDMQLKYNIYTAMNTRLEMALAKVQEATPAFTILNNATVPVKPAGPKRMLFVIAMLFLSTVGTVFYIYKKNIISEFSEVKKS